MKQNRSVLQCPGCEKPLVGIGSKVARIHLVARMIRDRYVTTMVIRFLLMPVVIGITYTVTSGHSGASVNFSFGLFALAMVSFVLNFLILRLFPVYRITDCPDRGFHEKQKLGLSESGEL